MLQTLSKLFCNIWTKVISADQITATQGLQQIPNNQITLSDGVLTQNAGW